MYVHTYVYNTHTYPVCTATLPVAYAQQSPAYLNTDCYVARDRTAQRGRSCGGETTQQRLRGHRPVLREQYLSRSAWWQLDTDESIQMHIKILS